MNPYDVLGLKRDAELRQIKATYRILSTKYHPDKKGGSREKFEELKLAYDILSDPKRRERYDTTGRTDESVVTPQRVQIFMNETMRNVIEAVRTDGFTDDPVWENIRDKILLSIAASRIPLKNDRFNFERKLERCNRLIERFKPKTEYDPVGIALNNERQRLEDELRKNQDAMELSIEAERVFKLYDYEVGPGPEGQVNPGPTLRRLLSGTTSL